MDLWSTWIWPLVMLLGRVSAFVASCPLLGWTTVPAIVRAGLAVLMTAFFAAAGPWPQVPAETPALAAGLMLVREVLFGLALGLACHVLFSAVAQGGQIISQLMGLSESGVIDPVTGSESEAMETFYQTVFAMLFLAAGGHQVLLRLLHRSYQVFPPGATPAVGSLAEVLLQAGTDMLGLALRVAGPLLAAFVILLVALAALARALPEANVLYLSFPLRTGLCVLVAAAAMPSLDSLAGEMGLWFQQFFAR